MIYYLFWVDLLCISVLISLAVFFWMLKTGQLSEQRRARFLPLIGERFAPLDPPPARSKAQLYAMFTVLFVGLLVLLGPFLVLLK